MADPKITPALADTLAATPEDDLVEVVVELAPAAPPPAAAATATRAARVQAMRTGFEADAAPVEEAIRRGGGEVVSRAWLNQTMRARLPRRALDAVCRLGEVRRVDRPGRLDPERSGEAD